MKRLPLTITYAVPARADIDSIYRDIAGDNPGAAAMPLQRSKMALFF